MKVGRKVCDSIDLKRIEQRPMQISEEFVPNQILHGL